MQTWQFAKVGHVVYRHMVGVYIKVNCFKKSGSVFHAGHISYPIYFDVNNLQFTQQSSKNFSIFEK